MPILYSPRRSDGKIERVFAEVGTDLYNDYVRGGFTVSSPEEEAEGGPKLVPNPFHDPNSSAPFKRVQYWTSEPNVPGETPAGDVGGTTYYPYQGSRTPDDTGGGTAGTTGGTSGGTGQTQFDQLLSTLEAYLNKLSDNGQVLNPNIEITPEKAAEFLRQAENEINPFFAGQLKVAREGFLSSVGYRGDELLNFENQLEQKYGQAVRGIGESAAERGFAQSGIRQREEQELAGDVQQQIDVGRRGLRFDVGQAAKTFTQQFGSGNLPGASLRNAPRVLAGFGQFQGDQSTSPFFNLSDDVYQNIIGTQEFSRRGAVKTRASQLEDAFRTQEAINQQRQLTF